MGRSMTPVRGMGVVADTAQEAVGDERGAAGTGGRFRPALVVDGDLEDFCGALDDEEEVRLPCRTRGRGDCRKRERSGEDRRPGRELGDDEGEGRISHDVGARGGALADDDVEFVVIEGGVELFFEDGLHARGISSRKEDLALRRFGEDGG